MQGAWGRGQRPPTPDSSGSLQVSEGHRAPCTDLGGHVRVGTGYVLMVSSCDQWAGSLPLFCGLCRAPLPLGPALIFSEAAQARLGVPEICL